MGGMGEPKNGWTAPTEPHGSLDLLYRLGLIDAEAADRMGFLNVVGLLMFPAILRLGLASPLSRRVRSPCAGMQSRERSPRHARPPLMGQQSNRHASRSYQLRSLTLDQPTRVPSRYVEVRS